MGKASSAKKVARAARAGGSRRAGQRRALGFPLTVFLVVALGLTLVLVAAGERITNAEPKVGDHIHAAYSTYTCVPDTGATDGSTTTTAPADGSSTTAPATPAPADASTTTTVATAPTDASTTTAPADGSSTTVPTSTTAAGPVTTIAGEGDVPGQFQAPFTDATQDVLGIHTHGDGVIHTHPFVSSVAGRSATLGVFFDQVGVQISDNKLTLPSGQVFEEGVTKCQGGKDGIVEIAQWSSATDAAAGKQPNAVFTDGFRNIHLSNREAFTIAFMPAGQKIPIEESVSSRLDTLGDVDNNQVSSTTEQQPSSDGSTTTAPADTGSTVTGAPPPSSSSSSSSSP